MYLAVVCLYNNVELMLSYRRYNYVMLNVALQCYANGRTWYNARLQVFMPRRSNLILYTIFFAIIQLGVS